MEKRGIRYQYDTMHKKKTITLIISIGIMIFCGIYFMTIGIADTSMRQVWHAITSMLNGTLKTSTGAESSAYKIILLIRLPRIVMAIFAGIGLSVSGVAMQAITRNPLVSPFTIGVSSAAAFGASVLIVFGTGTLMGSEGGIVMGAFISSMVCAALVYGVSKKLGMSPQSIVLTGTALNYLFSALTSTIEFFAHEHKLSGVVHWAFGTFNAITWIETLIVVGFVVICTAIIYRFSFILNVMSTSEDELTRSLGINPEYVRVSIGILSVLMTSAVISFTGVIGFVGLTGPHIARVLVGNDHRFLIPFSAVIGSILLMVADVIGRTVLSPVSIPVGIVVSFLGVPLFINLILSKKKGVL